MWIVFSSCSRTQTRPPILFRASKIVTESYPDVVNISAADKPAIPAPMIMTDFVCAMSDSEKSNGCIRGGQTVWVTVQFIFFHILLFLIPVERKYEHQFELYN